MEDDIELTAAIFQSWLYESAELNRISALTSDVPDLPQSLQQRPQSQTHPHHQKLFTVGFTRYENKFANEPKARKGVDLSELVVSWENKGVHWVHLDTFPHVNFDSKEEVQKYGQYFASANPHQAGFIVHQQQIGRFVSPRCGFLNRTDLSQGRSREYFSSWQLFRDCELHRVIPADRYYNLWIHHHPDKNYNRFKGSVAIPPRAWDNTFMYDLKRRVGVLHNKPNFNKGLWFPKYDPQLTDKKSNLLYAPQFKETIEHAKHTILPFIKAQSEEKGHYPFFVEDSMKTKVCGSQVTCDGVFTIIDSKDIKITLSSEHQGN